ncbi:MAG: DNA methyltransferase [Actinomycetota bacterium]|nr:DNA methyltransferase [Actinomycetota bacterium]
MQAVESDLLASECRGSLVGSVSTGPRARTTAGATSPAIKRREVEGRGGPEARPLHSWQQAVEPVIHWVQMTSEPGELVMDPFLGSGTTAVAAIGAGRRFVGGDIEAGNVATAKERLEQEHAARRSGEEEFS